MKSIISLSILVFSRFCFGLNNRCEIFDEDECYESAANCPIRINFPTVPYGDGFKNGLSFNGNLDDVKGLAIDEGYDPFTYDGPQNVRYCIESICDKELNDPSSSIYDKDFKGNYYTVERQNIINLQCWKDDNTCFSINEYSMIE